MDITEEDDGYTAVDREMGTIGHGETRAIALAELAIRLGVVEPSEIDLKRELRVLAERTRRRFAAEGVTEADVDDAIAWARSE